MEVPGTALVVGAGGGIGGKVVKSLVLSGATTVFAADMNLDAVQTTLQQLRMHLGGSGVTADLHALYMDVRDEKSVQSLLQIVKDKVERLDYFVNASGVGL